MSVEELKKKAGGVTKEKLEEMKRLHKDQVEDLVHNSNEKYQTMLAERMALEEDLRRQIKQQEMLAREEERAAGLKRYEQMEGQLRAELQAQAEQRMMAQRHDFEATLKKAKDDLLAKLEKLAGERDGFLKAGAEAERERDEARSELTQAQLKADRDLTATRNARDKALAELEALRNSATSDSDKLAREASEARGQLDAMRKQLRDMETQSQKQSSALLSLGEEKRKVEAEHESFSNKMTDEMVR